MEKRERGLPASLGSSQARALTSTTTLGGKARRSAATSVLFETGKAHFVETLTPLADDLAWGVESGSDDIVCQAIGGVEDDFGADDITIRRRIFSCNGL